MLMLTIHITFIIGKNMHRVISLPGYGKVACGKVSKANHPKAKQVFQYIGIPFAQPPTGQLRFLPPKRALPWDGVLCNSEQIAIPVQIMESMDTYFNFCPQRRNFFEKHCSEDCLYLNVFVPDIPESTKLPVMVWFYGGGFQLGPNMFFDGTALAGMNDVIVIVPNYRVNTFGFMSLGKDSKCRGNVGLLDQLQALKWVKESIVAFGGDKSNVTIFGESAGGISVNMHMLSPLSQGYFNKAISFSGTAAMARVFVKDQTRATQKLLESLNIDETEPDRILKKLQSLSTEEIRKADFNLLLRGYVWFPTLDDHFFQDTPKKLLSQGRGSKIPYLLGCNNSEGGWLMNITVPSLVTGSSEADYMKYCSSLLKHFNRSIDSKKALPLLCKTYNDKSPDEDKLYYSKGISGVMADTYFVTGIEQTAQIHAASGSPTYFYLLTQQPKYNHDDDYGPRDGRKPDYVQADHGDDVFLVWGSSFLPDLINDGFRYSEEEEILSKTIMTYVTNFAKTGNPNNGRPVDVSWPEYSSKDRQHLVLGTPLSTGSNFAAETVYLYTKFLPKL